MIYFFAGITIGLLLFALRDEFRSDGSLFPAFDAARDEWTADRAELFELPVPDGWHPDDVVRTLAEIEAL